MISLITFLTLACTPDSPPDDTAPAEDSDRPGETEEPQETALPEELPAVLVNELMADNAGAVVNEDGAWVDWLELYNAGDRVADLSGYTVSDDWTDKGKAILPEGTLMEPGGHLLLWADEREEAGHLPFKLDADGEGVGVFAPDGTALDWVTFPAQAEDFAWTRIPDGVENWQRVPHGTPGSANYWVERHVVSLVNRGDTWAYLDSGEYPGDAWTSVGYDDSAWASGPAPLGYGDYQPTELSYGDDEADKHPTAWFRHGFEVPEGTAGSVDSAILALRVDDGAVVWLNGAELLRQNMADGEIGPDSWAAGSISGEAESDYTDHSIAPELLLDGENQLAVEVHQVSATSSDLNLDLELTTETWVVLD
jgi:hypothetical protein